MINIAIKEIKDTDEEYPEKLRVIQKHPSKLYAIGNIELLQHPSIGIVGSRDASEYGKKYTAKFAKNIAHSNITIISGLAVGIDSVAHKSSINEIGKTIAVLGSGFNNIYPKENENLYKEIVEKGGLVISEYPPNTKPDLKNFPFRNRIIAGLSMAIIVVEAKFRSGSSITARYAFKQQKMVFCLPHQLEDKNGVGTNNLLKIGAKLITNTKEIGEFINIKIKEVQEDNNKDKNEISKISQIDTMEEKYKTIYKELLGGPVNINVLSKKLNLSIAVLNSYITIMEIKGYIQSLPGSEIKIKEK